MELLKNLKNSIYGPEYYRDIPLKKISYSLKYYFLMALAISLIATIIFSFPIVIGVKNIINYAYTKLVDHYPEKLEIVLKNGKVSTNVSEPYFVKMPLEIKNNISSNVSVNGMRGDDLSQIDNLLVIDTKNSFSLDEFNNYKTAVLLTADSVIYKEKNGFTIQQLKDAPDFILNKQVVNLFANKIKPYTVLAYPAAIIFFWLGRIFTAVGYLIYLFLACLLVMLILKIKKINISYWKSYQFGVHLLTSMLILDLLFLFIRFSPLNGFFTLIFILLAVINLNNIKPNDVKI